MANDNVVRMRFRPVGTAQRRQGAPEYSPLGTGCPAVEQAVAALYQAQNEESFWALMNALNYAMELDTEVLVPLAAAPGQEQGGSAPWAEHPVPAERAKELPLWLLRTEKERSYLPIFTSVKTAEAEQATAARPMTQMLLVDILQRALDEKDVDGVVLDPWTSSATLDRSLINGLLNASRESDEPGEEEMRQGGKAAAAGDWAEAFRCYDDAARQGRPEALTLLGELVYEGKDGIHKDVREARRFWKKAAETGDMLALVALGDDCIASGKGPGAALRYYRKAQKACCLTPDIAYLPQVKLRMAQYETRFTSRWLALAQLAEAKRGFAIRKREGDGDVSAWLEEADALTRQLLEEQNH